MSLREGEKRNNVSRNKDAFILIKQTIIDHPVYYLVITEVGVKRNAPDPLPKETFQIHRAAEGVSITDRGAPLPGLVSESFRVNPLRDPACWVTVA